MPDDHRPRKDTQIPTNLRLLMVMEEVAKRGVAVKPTDLIDALGLPKPTVHRLLQTAEAEGFLQRDLDGRSYGPGPAIAGLGRSHDIIGTSAHGTADHFTFRGRRSGRNMQPRHG